MDRALRLTSGERDYLFQAAGHNPPAPAAAATHVAPATGAGRAGPR
jgi:hypothetical protein